MLHSRGLSTAVGDEGGFATSVRSHEEAIELILTAIREAGFEAGTQIGLALDCASSEFHRDGTDRLAAEKLPPLGARFANLLAQWGDRYPIRAIEGRMREGDWEGGGTPARRP